MNDCKYCSSISEKFNAEIDRLKAQLEKRGELLRDRNKELEGALHKYGEHLDDCRILNEDPQPCSCGLLDVLAGDSDD